MKEPNIPKLLLLPFNILLVLIIGAVTIFCDLTWPIYKYFKGIKDE